MNLRRSIFLLAILAVGAIAALNFGGGSSPVHASGTLDIAVGSFHTCSVTSQDTVKCWGHNGSGQLGDGTTTHRSTPVEIGLGWVDQIEAGQAHTCALTLDSTEIKCWGANYSGQLGDGTTTQRTTPVVAISIVDGFQFTDLALARAHTCAVTDDGYVLCWGQGLAGELGNGDTSNSTDPVYVCAVGETGPCDPGSGNALTNVIDVELGWNHTCAQTSSGGTSGMVCWGGNNFGQLGDGQDCGSTSCSVPVHVCADSTATPPCSPGEGDALTGVHDIAVGGIHIVGYGCASLTAGNVKCWGDNRDGQLGDGTTTSRTQPVFVCASGASSPPCSPSESDALDGIGDVTAGGDVFSAHTCATAPGNDTALCWGDAYSGQLGDGLQCGASTGKCVTPTAVCGKDAEAPCSLADMDLLSDVAEIDAGGRHTCALTAKGAVGCWGDNTYGALGNDTTTSSTTPVDAQLWTAASSIDLGGHSCGIAAGIAQCWGPGSDGQIGDGSTSFRVSPQTVGGLSNVTHMSAGSAHTCAIDSGAAKCWGDNQYGQLGNNSTTDSSTPVQVSGLTSGVASISAGGHHTCAVTNAGAVKCWGSNENGQLGATSSHTCSSTPCNRTPITPIASGANTSASALAAGGQHSCAIASGGTSNLKCWGLGASGQLGQGQFQSSSTPINVRYQDLGGSATSVTAGSNHTCAAVGSPLKCWGLGSSGQLGIGPTSWSNFSVPKPVSGFGTSAGLITAGGNHTCALASGNTVKCWGENEYGQVGDGMVTDRASPTAVPNLDDVATIGTGLSHTCVRTTEEAGHGIKCWGLNTAGELGIGDTSSFEYEPMDVVHYAAKPLPSCGPGGSAGDLVMMIGAMAGLVLVGSRWRRTTPIDR